MSAFLLPFAVIAVIALVLLLTGLVISLNTGRYSSTGDSSSDYTSESQRRYNKQGHGRR